jgi:hypothetical protein
MEAFFPLIHLTHYSSSSDEDRGDEWFISPFLFGLHLPPLTSGLWESTLTIPTRSAVIPDYDRESSKRQFLLRRRIEEMSK